MRWRTGTWSSNRGWEEAGEGRGAAAAADAAAAAGVAVTSGGNDGGSGGGRCRAGGRSLLGPVVLGLFLLLLFGEAVEGGASSSSPPPPQPQPQPQPLREDHAVVAVTVDGHVHTLDAWSGNVRGVYVDSGGPLVSSSKSIDGDGSGDANGSGSGGAEGDGGRRGGGGPHHGFHRNALGEGLVVPGLDGVIYSLGADGRLSVLTSSAPDLVLEPRMACLTVNADSDGVVEDESCGLLIGEKTTELFSLDTETGTARRMGGGVQNRPSRESSGGGGGKGRHGGGGGADEDWGAATDQGEKDEEHREYGSWKWGYDSQRQQQQQDQPPPPPPPPTSNSNLLLQRDEYVVRALDAETSEELWFVTVAHFSALDLQGRGGTAALTRATVATADREGYARAVRARSVSSDYLEGLVKALPPPLEEDADFDGWNRGTGGVGGCDGSWSFGKDLKHKAPPGGGGQQARRRGRFGEEHADRFPYLLYEDNAFVVAMDPMDGSVLWRKEMPALAVSLYGIRGREWVDILPPPMSMLQPPPGYYPSSPSATSLIPRTSFDGSSNGRESDSGSDNGSDDWLAGEEVDWSHQDGDEAGPLLLLTNGNSDRMSDSGRGDDSASSYSNESGDGGSDDDDGHGEDSSSRHGGADGSGSRTACPVGEGEGGWCADDTSTLGGPGNTLVPAAVVKLSGIVGGGGEKMTGLLQPGLRRGQLQAQVGVVNGHFYVSSSLRRGPLHAAVVEDRYPHPTTGMAGRRPLVDAAGRDARDGLGAGAGGAGTMGLTQMPPHVPKTPPHAARPLDQAAGPTIFVADGRTGGGLGPANSNAVSGAGSGGVDIGDWKQALQNRFERDMLKERMVRSSNDAEAQPDGTGFFMSWRFLEAHPDNQEGLFMTWRALAVLVGGVVATVAGVAYLAYKHGATAMSNMSTITRRAGSATRLSRHGSPAAAGVGGGNGSANGRKRPVGISATARERVLFGDALSGRLSPPAMAQSPSLQHGASASAMFGGPRLNGFPAGEGPAASLTEAVLQRSRSMHDFQLQRVHSLPALSQSHSPPEHDDARWRQPLQAWHSLFGSHEGPPGGVANGGGCGGGGGGGDAAAKKLKRAASAAVDKPSSPPDSVMLGSGSGSGCCGCGEGSAFSSASPSPRPDDFLEITPLKSVREGGTAKTEGFSPRAGSSGAQAAVTAAGMEGSPPSSAASGTSSPEVSSRGEWTGGGGSRRGREDPVAGFASAVAVAAAGTAAVESSGRRRRQRSGSRSGAPSRSESEDEAENDSEERRRRQQQQLLRRRRAQTRLSQDFSPSNGEEDRGGDEQNDGGSGRSRKSSVATGVGGRDRNGGGSRRASRSPRSSVASTEELVLGAGGGGGGGGCGDDIDSTVIGTGGDDEDALLVTNRRLRTEFVEGQKLGKGGFGTVFKCRNRLDGHDYAIKKIRLSSDPRWQPQLEKVLREVKIMSLLDHPNIVRYYQAWLEKFTEEDEELLLEEGAPSAVSESWDQTSGGGSRMSNLHHQHPHHQRQHTGTGITAASNKTKMHAYTGSGNHGVRGTSNGDALHGFDSNGFGPNPVNSPLFVTTGGLLQTGGGEEDRRHWDNWPGLSPRQSASTLAKPVFEDQSMDGWSIDSRNADDRGNRHRGGGGDDLGRLGAGRAWGDVSFCEDGDDHDDDEEEGEQEEDDEDEASMPGFVFDREVSGDITREEEKEGGEGDGKDRVWGGSSTGDGWLVGESGNEGEDGSGGGRGGSGGSGGSGGEHEAGWMGVGERRPSGSVSVLATAAASVYAEDKEGYSEGRVDTRNLYPSPPLAPAAATGERAEVRGERSGSDSQDGHNRRGHGGNDDDDDSFSWDRARPLPPQNGSGAAADSDGPGLANASDGDEEPECSLVEELTLADVPRERPATMNGPDRRHGSRAHHRSDGEGKVAAAAIAAEAEEAERKQRPRGQSWPAAAHADGGGPVGAETMLDARKRRPRSSAAAAYPAAVAAATASKRRRNFGKGVWQNERAGGRARGRAGRRQSKEVYDLWLYIQMQYCSHNNLQYFLDEEPTRRAQTRVDMPKVMHIFMQVARGLEYVHACGLIHRDLKPANCFLMRDGTVKIGDFGLSRHILPADGINGGAAAATAAAASVKDRRASFAWESDHPLGGAVGGDESITGGVGTYLYASPEQMSGKGYDEKTDVYSLGMLLFEMCHPPFGTKMERFVVLTAAHRLQFPAGDVWGPPKGQEAIKNMCRSMLQEQSGKRPSAADIVRQVELMQGKHMVLQLDKKPPASYLGADRDDDSGRPVDMAVVLRVEALDQDGLLHRLVDRIRALCKGQGGHDDAAGGGGGGGDGGGSGGGARLEQYGLRGHTGSAIMEFLIAGAKLEEREVIIAALESLPEVKTVREFPADG
eukprot:g15105.t1